MYGFRVCPYCRKKYHYGKIISGRGKIRNCRYCKKNFEVNRSLKYLIVLIAGSITVIINVLIMFLSTEIETGSFKMMVISDAMIIASAFLISPFFVRLKAVNDTADRVQPDFAPMRRLI